MDLHRAGDTPPTSAKPHNLKGLRGFPAWGHISYFESEYFVSFHGNALISIIGRVDLQMEEATLWNCLSHTCYFQIPGDEKDVTDKFRSPNRQILSKILPPRVILTPKLLSRYTEPFSEVIDEAHVAEIAAWKWYWMEEPSSSTALKCCMIALFFIGKWIAIQWIWKCTHGNEDKVQSAWCLLCDLDKNKTDKWK
ncbi:hypothetical protein C2G38_2163952 [Gigaspora rosea]|uniref:Uncharacterized protein n=1 Tax=Gigaspora rosea TaxID=44941 RepID=A0A397W1M9_9GLOM|nr:hypothetical protein C2G38_2163952 [Gigaspora rosea]